jgi:hypothetical protein
LKIKKLKIALLYLFFYTYLTIILKPAMADVCDFLAPGSNYANHMARAHEHKGKYHVHFEYMGKQKRNGEKPSQLFHKEVFSGEHLITGSEDDFFISRQKKDDRIFRPPALSFDDIAQDFPSPKIKTLRSDSGR